MFGSKDLWKLLKIVFFKFIEESLTKKEINFYVFQNKLETLNYYPIDTYMWKTNV